MDASDLALLALFAAAVQVGLGRLQGLYTGRWRFGSFEEVAALVVTVGVTTVLTFVVNLAFGRLVPSGAVLAAGLVALVVMGGLRYGWRLYLEGQRRPDHETVKRTVVYGAGDAAHQLTRAMTTDPRSPLLPVAAVDDDPAKQQHRLARRVRVEGTGSDLARVAERHRAEVVVLAIPSADSELVRRVVAEGEAAGLDVRVLPPLWELAKSDVDLSDVRPVTVVDLLGRHELDLDIASIADYLTDRRVLVTGAGGSIGSELCRQIKRFDPGQLVMLDRDESALHALQLSMDGTGPGRRRIAWWWPTSATRTGWPRCSAPFRPEVVFHAAALKHVPLLELHPGEALKTNVCGTRNVLEAAAAAGVDRFINVSTDKAADPVNVLGRSKLLAECLTAGVAEGSRRHLRVGPLRQRPGQPGLGAHDLRAPGGQRRTRHRDPPRRHPLLHDRRGGGAARHPGRGRRRGRRRPRPGHGRAGAASPTWPAGWRSPWTRRWRSVSPACAPARSCPRCSSAAVRTPAPPSTRSSPGSPGDRCARPTCPSSGTRRSAQPTP